MMRRLLLHASLGLLVAAAGQAAPTVSAEDLPEADPVVFLENCLERYDRSGLKGYSCLFVKQERVGGKLLPPEKVEAHFREQPHSIYMRWLEGGSRATAVLYVEGENGGQMLCRPKGLAGRLLSVASRDPDGSDARQSGRYTVKDFGVRKAAVRTLDAWKKARDQGTLKVRSLGTQKVREVGDRTCYVLHRSYAGPEEDGVLDGTFYLDRETWAQVGSVLKDERGQLVGSYFFRDLRFNPTFKPNQFQRAALLE